jgi:hypothetical protein
MRVTITHNTQVTNYVHAAGCRDLAKVPASQQHTGEWDSFKDIVFDIYAGFEELEAAPEDWQGFAATAAIRQMPCAHALPTE